MSDVTTPYPVVKDPFSDITLNNVSKIDSSAVRRAVRRSNIQYNVATRYHLDKEAKSCQRVKIFLNARMVAGKRGTARGTSYREKLNKGTATVKPTGRQRKRSQRSKLQLSPGSHFRRKVPGIGFPITATNGCELDSRRSRKRPMSSMKPYWNGTSNRSWAEAFLWG